MEQTEATTDKVLAFDTIFTNNHIKMMKVLLAYLDPHMQKMLAVYIKFLELQYTLSFFSKHTYAFPECRSSSGKMPDIDVLCKEITPYCSPSERKKFEQLKQMQKTMESVSQMSQTMEMVKDLFPDGMPSFGDDNSQMFDILAAMMNN